MNSWGLIIILILFYLGLTSNLEPINVLVGVMLALLIVRLLRPELRPIQIRNIPQMFFSLLKYIVWLIWDVITSGIQVARLVIDPKLPIHPGILAIPSGAKSNIGEALSAHALSLTPGELVVEIGEDGTLYTHCLETSKSVQYLEDAQRMRTELLDKIIQ